MTLYASDLDELVNRLFPSAYPPTKKNYFVLEQQLVNNVCRVNK